MTENNKVSAIAFSVLILGMLGFFVALAADLFFSPSPPAVVAPATPTLPKELQNSVMQDRARSLEGIRQNFEFNLMGGAAESLVATESHGSTQKSDSKYALVYRDWSALSLVLGRRPRRSAWL